MSKRDHIIEAVQEALSIDTRGYDRRDIFPRKSLTVEECSAAQLDNVLKSIAPGCPAEDILLIVDTTNGKGKRGLVFTEHTLYISKDIMHTVGFFSKPIPQPIRYEEFAKMEEEYYENGKVLTLPGQDGRRYVLSHGSYTSFISVLWKRLNWAMMEVKEEEEKQQKDALARSAGEIIAQGEALAAGGDLPGMVRCFAQAAETGDGQALYRYAQLFEEGRGVEQDDKTAFRWYEKAYYKGSLDARVKLAELLMEGRGTGIDTNRAISLYHSAAVFGHPEGQYRYAQLIKDRGEEDLALSYLEKAANQGHPQAAEVYRQIKERQDREYAQAVSDYQAENYKEAAYNFVKLAHRGMAKACYQSGYMYWCGEGVPRDEEIAFSYFKSAADSGYTPGMMACAKLYRSGQGVKEDRGAAHAMIKKAAELGDVEAKLALQQDRTFDPYTIFYVNMN